MITTGRATFQSNQEIFVNTNRIFIDGEKIIVSLNGDIEYNESIKIKKAILEFLATFTNKVDLIIDFKKAKIKSTDSRHTFDSFREMKQIAKVDCIGGNFSNQLFQNIKRGLLSFSRL
ncbi:MAG TPA: hypothetical protein VD908_16040 [Cytophagales bacterium]|nr:hypothetical protein [Cytophagales bacterium]